MPFADENGWMATFRRPVGTAFQISWAVAHPPLRPIAATRPFGGPSVTANG
jgi:hypothetical protein